MIKTTDYTDSGHYNFTYKLENAEDNIVTSELAFNISMLNLCEESIVTAPTVDTLVLFLWQDISNETIQFNIFNDSASQLSPDIDCGLFTYEASTSLHESQVPDTSTWLTVDD